MIDPAAIFHTGYVVDDVEEGMLQVETVLDITWTPVEHRSMTLRGPAGPFDVALTYVYSQQGPVHVELMGSVPGTPWQAARAPAPVDLQAAHHIGVWADDIVEESARLEAAGVPRLATYDGEGGGVRGFAYHRLPSGLLVELVDVGRRDAFERWFAGGPFPSAQQ